LDIPGEERAGAIDALLVYTLPTARNCGRQMFAEQVEVEFMDPPRSNALAREGSWGETELWARITKPAGGTSTF